MIFDQMHCKNAMNCQLEKVRLMMALRTTVNQIIKLILGKMAMATGMVEQKLTLQEMVTGMAIEK